MTIKGPSKWRFETSGGGGFSVELFAFEGGHLVLYDPQGKKVSLSYRALGVGPSIGLKVPKIKKLPNIFRGKGGSASGSTESMDSHGTFSILSACDRDELVLEDLKGLCLFGEAGAGLIKNWSRTCMFMGCDLGKAAHLWAADPAGDAGEELLGRVLDTAKARLETKSVSIGLQAGFGGAVYAGVFY